MHNFPYFLRYLFGHKRKPASEQRQQEPLKPSKEVANTKDFPNLLSQKVHATPIYHTAVNKHYTLSPPPPSSPSRKNQDYHYKNPYSSSPTASSTPFPPLAPLLLLPPTPTTLQAPPTLSNKPSPTIHSCSLTSSLSSSAAVPCSRCLATCSMRSSQDAGPEKVISLPGWCSGVSEDEEGERQYPHELRGGGERRLFQHRWRMLSRVASKASASAGLGGLCMRRMCWVKRSLRLKSLWPMLDSSTSPRLVVVEAEDDLRRCWSRRGTQEPMSQR